MLCVTLSPRSASHSSPLALITLLNLAPHPTRIGLKVLLRTCPMVLSPIITTGRWISLMLHGSGHYFYSLPVWTPVESKAELDPGRGSSNLTQLVPLTTGGQNNPNNSDNITIMVSYKQLSGILCFYWSTSKKWKNQSHSTGFRPFCRTLFVFWPELTPSVIWLGSNCTDSEKSKLRIKSH